MADADDTAATEHAARARAWAAHLLAGGTTPWSEYAAHPAERPADGDADGHADGDTRLPGAQELEVLRRLNLLGPVEPALSREVLAAAPPGRGQLDLPLAGAPVRGYGARPVDPADLAPRELIRVVTGVLADRLAALPLGPAPAPTTAERLAEQARDRLPRRHAFRLVGPTVRVDPVRARLRALGRTPGGRGAVHYLLGTDVDRLVTDAWASRVVEGVAPPWPEWLATWVDRDTCPPRADLVALADGWAQRRGHDRVEVVLDASTLGGLLATDGAVVAPDPLPAALVELVRGVSAVLGVLVERPRRSRLLGDVLVPGLAPLAADAGPALTVPDRHADWLARRGRVLAGGLRDGGYRVHGPPGLLTAPVDRDGVGAPDDDTVLQLALRAVRELDLSVPREESR